ncbi:PEP-utilizing family enzyme [Nonomuraea polychroma]|uniref:Phosphoenolpyruvate-protein phosphotransferase n=1 Tax=Nonomuraea polychroma TaxID=46176 RepID=A0A438M1P5_9ACTN|nr:PEP-utilizing enzyme [Nonomuraea polychroma]RVX39740.1 PEP-utilizing family enzyme [Nonomuraea polychroma]
MADSLPGMSGLGVSPGRTAGPVVRMAGPPVLPPPRPAPDTDMEVAAVSNALDAVVAELRRRAHDARDGDAAEILDARSLPMPGVPAPGYPYVLLAEDLSPADTAGLGGQVLALVTEKGGPTSHTAILARGRGLPAVVACPGVLDLPDGTVVSVDGTTGEIGIGLTPEAAEQVRARAREERARLAASAGPGQTAGQPAHLRRFTRRPAQHRSRRDRGSFRAGDSSCRQSGGAVMTETETFRLLAWTWDVSAAKRYAANRAPNGQLLPRNWTALLALMVIDEDHAETVNLVEPLIGVCPVIGVSRS